MEPQESKTAVDAATLVAWLIRAVQAERVLEIGTGDGRRTALIASHLPRHGRLIVVEGDAGKAAHARQLMASAGHAGVVSVIAGDAARYLHKIAGPFDVIVQDGALEGAGATHERLCRLLRPRGLLCTHGLSAGGDYNEQIHADARLETMVLPFDGGLAVSLKTADRVEA